MAEILIYHMGREYEENEQEENKFKALLAACGAKI